MALRDMMAILPVNNCRIARKVDAEIEGGSQAHGRKIGRILGPTEDVKANLAKG
jgi:hypothetical protein